MGHSCTSCFSCTICTFICLGFLFFAIGLPILVFLHPSNFKDPNFFLNQTSITSFNLTPEGHLTGMFGVVIRVENPNHKHKIKYEDIRVKISKDGQKLAKDKVKNFTQRKGNVTVLRAEPIVLNVKLKKGPAFDFGMEKGMGYLQFGVVVDGMVNTEYNLYVFCLGRVNVSSFSPISNINAQNLQSTKCSVSVYVEDNSVTD